MAAMLDTLALVPSLSRHRGRPSSSAWITLSAGLLLAACTTPLDSPCSEDPSPRAFCADIHANFAIEADQWLCAKRGCSFPIESLDGCHRISSLEDQHIALDHKCFVDDPSIADAGTTTGFFPETGATQSASLGSSSSSDGSGATSDHPDATNSDLSGTSTGDTFEGSASTADESSANVTTTTENSDSEADTTTTADGRCADPPANPANGTHASDCSDVPHEGTCELTCDPGYVPQGTTMCSLGTWESATCAQLGILRGTITDAVSGELVANARLHVEGQFDPATETCADSEYCEVTNANGRYEFAWFPEGMQTLKLTMENYEPIDRVVEVALGSEQEQDAAIIPDGVIDGAYVVVVSWEVERDVDVLASDAEACVNQEDSEFGSLTEAPFMLIDPSGNHDMGPEFAYIKKNETDDKPSEDKPYTIEVWDHSDSGTGISVSKPEVRLLSRDKNGIGQLTIYTPPADVADDIVLWQPFTIAADGSITNGTAVLTRDEIEESACRKAGM